MNIAIIGCGYVGTAVAHQWTEAGHLVTATTTTPERVPQLERVAQRAVVMKADDPDALASVVQNQDVVLLSVGAPNSTAYKETYLDTAKNLTAVLKEAPRVKQLIYTGSYSVYEDKNGEWVDENSTVAPATEKGKILYKTEQMLRSAASDRLKVCILRLAGIYGPGREIITIFRRLAGTTQPGTGGEFSNWIHLDDIVEAIAFVCRSGCDGVYNLVNDVPLTRRLLLDRLCERHSLAKVTWDPSATSVRPYNARVSNQKLKQAGFQLKYPETQL